MAIALWVEAYGHETILGSTPVFAVVGILIAGVSRIKDRNLEFIAGIFTPPLTAFIVFSVNLHGCSPATGDNPITVMIIICAAVFCQFSPLPSHVKNWISRN